MGKPKILVAIDFSDAARHALDWAVDWSIKSGAELHLLHVVEDSFLEMLGGPPRQRLETELALVSEKAAEELARLGKDLPTTRHVARGHAAAEIIRVAEKLGAELVVLGNHGRTTPLIGSTAERVVRHAPTTVVCVKGGK
jgi:nucleotide-binding universal stress UspA family protein